MAILQRELVVATRGRGFVDITAELARHVAASGVESGMCTVFLMHTSASLLIQENSDPAVLRDLLAFFDELAPESRAYEHDAEGPDDMPAHIKAALSRTSETIPIRLGRLWLGTWQAIYLFEHRRAAHERRLAITIVG